MKKSLLFLLIITLVASSAFGATTYRYEDVVQTVRGDAVSGALITVYKASTDTLATLYSGALTSTATVTNPTRTNAFGRYSFYTISGSYDVVISGSNLTPYTMSDLRLFGSSLAASEVTNDSSVPGTYVDAALDTLFALDYDWAAETADLITTGNVYADSLTLTDNIHLHKGGTAGTPAILHFYYGAGTTPSAYLQDEGGTMSTDASFSSDSFIASGSYINAESNITAGNDGTGFVSTPVLGGLFFDVSDGGAIGEVATSDGTYTSWQAPGNILTMGVKPTTTTLTAAESGSFISNTGAAGAVVLTLPAGVAGYNYKIYSVENQTITLDPPAGVTIQLGAVVGAADTGTIVTSLVGDSCEIICTSATTWVVTRYTSGWSF
jgi:hypothetical protein